MERLALDTDLRLIGISKDKYKKGLFVSVKIKIIIINKIYMISKKMAALERIDAMNAVFDDLKDTELTCCICLTEFPLKNGLLCNATDIFYPDISNQAELLRQVRAYNQEVTIDIPELDDKLDIDELREEFHERMRLNEVLDNGNRHFTCNGCLVLMIPFQIAGPRLERFCQTRLFTCFCAEANDPFGNPRANVVQCQSTYFIDDIFAHLGRRGNNVRLAIQQCIAAAAAGAAGAGAAPQAPAPPAPPAPDIGAAAHAAALVEYDREVAWRQLVGPIRQLIIRLPPLQTVCPHCQHPFPSFDGCCSVTCATCRWHFCGYCLQEADPVDAHRLAANCRRNPKPGDVFCSVTDYVQLRIQDFQALVNAYIRTVTPNQRAAFIYALHAYIKQEIRVRQDNRGRGLLIDERLLPAVQRQFMLEFQKQFRDLLVPDDIQMMPGDWYFFITLPVLEQVDPLFRQAWDFHLAHPGWIDRQPVRPVRANGAQVVQVAQVNK
jgi:hypothetical protein